MAKSRGSEKPWRLYMVAYMASPCAFDTALHEQSSVDNPVRLLITV